MALIHVSRDRETLGKFTEVEVSEGLRLGKFRPDDLAWQDPMESWKPLSTFTRLFDDQGANSPDHADEMPVPIPEPAWERGEGIFRPQAVVDSMRQILVEPSGTFRALPPAGGLLKPLQLAVLVGWFAGAFAVGYQLTVSLINPEMFFGEIAKSLTPSLIVGSFIAAWILMPVFIVMGILLSAACLHFGLVITGGASRPFTATMRALAYTTAATSIFQIIPLCGGYLSTIASVVYAVIALREVHQTETWRVILATLIVFLLVCGILVGVLMALAALITVFQLAP